MNKKKELFEAIKVMNRDELTQYHSSAMMAGRCVDVIGITIIFLLLWLANPFLAIPGVVFIYIIAQIGSGLDQTIEYIEKRMVRHAPKKDEQPTSKDDEVDK
jgi:hypothetical protein